MRAVVTGCAGFVGSHLSERLVAEGLTVTGVDAFTDYYERSAKEANLASLVGAGSFTLVEADLSMAALEPIFAGADVVFHLAAQPGVRGSFGPGFADYVRHNVMATQRVFEAATATGCRRVVMASSSSVYGDAEAYPCVVGVTDTQPRSPYGVSKRTCEDLAAVYRASGLDTVALRYFTVYGPRQRPDMAMRRICEAAVGGPPFEMYGDGSQSRDFTHVVDIVDATFRAGTVKSVAPVFNVGGGHETSLARVIDVLATISGTSIPIIRYDVQRGDVRRTAAHTAPARRLLGWPR